MFMHRWLKSRIHDNVTVKEEILCISVYFYTLSAVFVLTLKTWTLQTADLHFWEAAGLENRSVRHRGQRSNPFNLLFLSAPAEAEPSDHFLFRPGGGRTNVQGPVLGRQVTAGVRPARQDVFSLLLLLGFKDSPTKGAAIEAAKALTRFMNSWPQQFWQLSY